MESINGIDLYQMFNYGTVFVMQQRKHLNDINVFPVADGDTGNNLAHTLTTILRESVPNQSFSTMIDSISNSALIGARGNSGVIFAQFINGLRKSTNEQDSITVCEFGKMLEESYKHTYSSLSNPVEGTMLTIMKELPIFVKDGHNESTKLNVVFDNVYAKSKKLLQKTTKMLDVLTENDVVDSGALGFVLFLKGISSYFNKEDVNLVEYENVEIEDSHSFHGEITYRYCTEGLVKNNNIDEQKLKDDLSLFGDSIIVATGKNRFRTHIHTNYPEKVFETLKEYGEVESQKVDDMQLEMQLKNSTSNRVLVTDSIADISKEILTENNVVVIPVSINLEGVSYIDKTSINNEILFKSIETLKEYPSTAAISIKYVNDLFNKLLLQFNEIVVITVSKELSATHNIILNEAAKLNNQGKKIYIVDSKNNSASEGLLVQKGIELFKTDKKTEDIVFELEELSNKTQILVCLNTFKYATLSGRVPKVIGKIGMLIGLRPIMSLEKGKGAAFGFAFTKKAITKKISKFVQKDYNTSGIDSYSLVHCINEDLVNEYKTIFTNIIGKEPEYISDVSSATSIHSGLGTVAIGYIKK